MSRTTRLKDEAKDAICQSLLYSDAHWFGLDRTPELEAAMGKEIQRVVAFLGRTYTAE